MIKNFGENLKSLRRKKDLTQDEIAKILNVSTQTISRWETNMGYPDIEMLPSIANFYNVTIDSLLGLDIVKKKERINEIIESISILRTNGERNKCIEILRNSLKEYPNDFQLMEALASCLFNYGKDDEERNKNNEEVIIICEEILKECMEDAIRHQAIQLLCYTYPIFNKKEKALELAKSMPTYFVTSNELTYSILEGDEKINYCHGNLHSLIQIIVRNVWAMFYSTKESIEKINLLKSLVKVYESFFEDSDYFFIHYNFHTTYRYIAAVYADIKNYDETLDYIEKAANHAIAYDSRPENFTYTSPFFKGVVDAKNYSFKNSTRNETWVLLDKLKDERYDFVREDKRFIDIIDKIKQYAKE